jgi:predicted transposase YdaD
MEHDHSYKLLFSHREMMADLLRGFVTEAWVQAVDLNTLERVHSSHISDDLREREDDILWRVRWQDDWLYIYLLVEFQSTIYRYMAVRLTTYVGLLYEGLIRSHQLTPARLLPPVAPIVLYNGRERWTAPLNIAALIAEAPGGLEIARPSLPYLLLDVGRYTDPDLAPLHNLVAALFRLENSRTPTDIQQVLAVLITWLRDPAQENLRRAFTVWLRRVLLPARLPTVFIPEVQELVEVQTMLAERVIEWTQQWKEEGLQAGLQAGREEGLQAGREEGLQVGLAAERALLLRQARTRFGEACATALAPLLASFEDTAVLADIGEWIITSESAAALLTSVCARFEIPDSPGA